MSRLLLLNGLPPSGKSTIACRYAQRHPPTVALDVDELRGSIAGWSSRPTESGLQARASAIATAGIHLRASRDVIVPQYLGRLDFVMELQRLAAEVGAQFIEIVLAVEPAAAADRFRRRSDNRERSTHRDAALLLSHDDAAAWAEMQHRLAAVTAARTATIVISSAAGAIDDALDALERAINP